MGSKVTSDGGLFAYRELGAAFRLTELADDAANDSPVGKHKQPGIVPLLQVCRVVAARASLDRFAPVESVQRRVGSRGLPNRLR